MTVARRSVVDRLGDQSTASLTSRRVADPLRLDAVRHEVVPDAGCDLHERTPAQQLEHPRPRRRPALHVEDAAAPTASRGVREGGIEAAHVDGRRVTDLHGAGQAEGGEGRARPSPPARGPGRSRPPRGLLARTRAGHRRCCSPRSTTLPPGIAAASRAARWSATRVRVACSSASGVKNISGAASPNFATALRRSCAWVVAAAAFSGSGSRRRTSLATRTGSPAWSARRAPRGPGGARPRGSAASPASRSPLGHPVIPSASTRLGRVLASVLALSPRERQRS